MITAVNKMENLKSYLGFLLLILLFLSLGIFTIKGLFSIGSLTKTIYEHPLVVSNASLQAALNITKMHRSMKDVVLANSPNEIEISLKSVSENEQKVFKQLDIIKKYILGDLGKSVEQETRLLFVKWKPIREEVIQLLELGDKQKAILITKGKGADHVASLENKMIELTSYARNKATGFIELAEDNHSRLEKVTIFLTFTGVLLSFFITFFATTSINNAREKIIDKNNELQKALDEIKTLRGIIPICSYCKKIRDDKGAWERFESYISHHTEAQFSHGLCPKCYKKQMDDLD